MREQYSQKYLTSDEYLSFLDQKVYSLLVNKSIEELAEMLLNVLTVQEKKEMLK